jgi:hypothetical protein
VDFSAKMNRPDHSADLAFWGGSFCGRTLSHSELVQANAASLHKRSSLSEDTRRCIRGRGHKIEDLRMEWNTKKKTGSLVDVNSCFLRMRSRGSMVEVEVRSSDGDDSCHFA